MQLQDRVFSDGLLAGRAVLISGADTPVGRAAAIRMAEAGASVALAGRDAAALAATAATVEGLGRPVVQLPGDRRDPQAALRATELTVEAFGTVHVLVNAIATPPGAALEQLTEADWDDVIDGGLKGAFNFIKHASNVMVKQRYGKIVNVSARELLGREFLTHFAAVAAAIVSLTRTCAIEMGRFQINVNAVAPGEIAWTTAADQASRLRAEATPLRRLGRPEEVADAILFLASDAASFISGQTLFVAGGQELLPALVLEPSAIDVTSGAERG